LAMARMTRKPMIKQITAPHRIIPMKR
jgi:hypothetical protein